MKNFGVMLAILLAIVGLGLEYVGQALYLSGSGLMTVAKNLQDYSIEIGLVD